MDPQVRQAILLTVAIISILVAAVDFGPNDQPYKLIKQVLGAVGAIGAAIVAVLDCAKIRGHCNKPEAACNVNPIDPVSPEVSNSIHTTEEGANHITITIRNTNDITTATGDTKCITITAGNTMYLACGHISDGHTYHEDCESSHCLTSRSHSTKECRHGYETTCPTCVQENGACCEHHTCRPCHGSEVRYNRTSSGMCNDCAESTGFYNSLSGHRTRVRRTPTLESGM